MKNKPGRAERIAKVRDYTERCKASGDKFQPMWCPHCRFELEAKVPDDNDPYTTLATCPSCESMFHYTSRPMGVEVRAPGMRSMTNLELMKHLFGKGCDHPFQEVFILNALLTHCEAVAKAEPGFLDSAGGLISEDLWRQISKNVHQYLIQRPMVKDHDYDEEQD